MAVRYANKENEEIINAIRKVINIPDNIISLKLELKLDEVPRVIIEKLTERVKVK